MTAGKQFGGGVGSGAEGAEDRLAETHRRLLAEGRIQFDVPAFHVDPPPAWAVALGRWLKAHASEIALAWPLIKWGLFIGLALMLFLLLRAIVLWGRPQLRRQPAEEPMVWRPSAAPARALLAEADALAAAGDYAAAARLVLLRSVEQIEAHRADPLAPALTSRDIARSPLLPPDVARAFALIAAVVELGLFAARPVAADAWARCRAAYEAVALRRSWA